MRCPRCGSELRLTTGIGAGGYRCPAGCGQFLTLAALRSLGAEPRLVNELWCNAKTGNCRPGVLCPNCGRVMQQLKLGDENTCFDLDLCTGCQSLWFDSGELERLPLPPPPLQRTPKENLHRLEPITVGENELHDPDDGWGLRFLPAMFMLPVERSPRKLSRIPFVTFGAALLCLAIHGILLWRGELVPAMEKWGLIPAQWSRYGGVTLISSMFLHTGIVHLLGNTYFLLLCGDDAEDVLGHGSFLLLLLLSGLSASFVYILFCGNADIPCVGASGFISGIIAYYAATFPKASLGICFTPRRRLGWALFSRDTHLLWLYFPAWAWFAIYLLLNLLGAWLSPDAPVAWLAHLGGVIPGIAFAVWNRCNRDAPDIEN